LNQKVFRWSGENAISRKSVLMVGLSAAFKSAELQ